MTQARKSFRNTLTDRLPADLMENIYSLIAPVQLSDTSASSALLSQ